MAMEGLQTTTLSTKTVSIFLTMVLLQHLSPVFFSSLVPRKPPVTRRPANFHLIPLPDKPRGFRRLAKYHHSAVCKHSSPESFTLASPEKPPVVRRQFNYHPPTWDYEFIESFNESHQEHETFNKIRIEELKEKVKNLLIHANDSLQKMNLVDAIERLGLAYHFDEEIQSTLQQVYEDNDDYGDNLHVIALRFLLLRQHGYYVSCDVFEKFTDKEGNFKQSLRSDVRGLLSLYEASHCSVRGEDILDNSLTFTRQVLKSMGSHMDHALARRVQRSLELIPQRGLPRLEAKCYISIYEDDEARNDVLLELAKLDFNLVQSLHRHEIKEVYRWWKALELAEKLPYARDRVVENYVWGMQANSLPKFSNGRIALAKMVNLMALIDDTYDTYGTLDEMELFTDAINRWDINAMDQLEEYLKLPYLAFFNLVNDIEHMSTKHQENNAIYYVKKTLQDYCNASMKEARWFHDGYMPSMDEYLSNSLTTAGGFLILSTAARGMGDMVDQEGLAYIVGDSKLPKLVNTIGRLLDDIATFKFEQERGEVAKSIACYMNEHGVSQEEACMHIKNMVAEAWTDINQELLNHIPLPKPLGNGILNFGKLSEMYYLNGNDGFGNSQCWFKDNINSMLFEPIPM